MARKKTNPSDATAVETETTDEAQESTETTGATEAESGAPEAPEAAAAPDAPEEPTPAPQEATEAPEEPVEALRAPARFLVPFGGIYALDGAIHNLAPGSIVSATSHNMPAILASKIQLDPI